MRYVIPLAVAALVTACAGEQTATVKLQFQPAAYGSDEFGLGPTNVTNVDGCLIPDDIATIQVRAYGEGITSPAPREFAVADIDAAECTLAIPLPPGAEIELVIRAFDSANALVRKGGAVLEPFEAGEEVLFPAPLWPAKRLDDAADEGIATDLRYVEVVRQFDQFIIELAFADIVYPATLDGQTSLRGYIDLTNTDTDTQFIMGLDAGSSGLTVFNLTAQSNAQAEFQFIVGGLQIALPYTAVGGADGTDEGVIDAPAINFAITLVDGDDNVIDGFPEADAEAATLN